MKSPDKRIRIDPPTEQRVLAEKLASLEGCDAVDIYNRAVKVGLAILEKHVRQMWAEVQARSTEYSTPETARPTVAASTAAFAAEGTANYPSPRPGASGKPEQRGVYRPQVARGPKRGH